MKGFVERAGEAEDDGADEHEDSRMLGKESDTVSPEFETVEDGGNAEGEEEGKE